MNWSLLVVRVGLLSALALACTPQSQSSVEGGGPGGTPPGALPVALVPPPDLMPLPGDRQDEALTLLLGKLAPKPGQRVLVVGGGGGWLTFPLAHAVGEAGRVVYLAAYRYDEPELGRQASAAGLTNLEAYYYPEQVGRLPGAGFDLVLLFEFPSEDLGSPEVARRLASWVAPGGRLWLAHPIPFPDFSLRSRWSSAEAWTRLCALGPQAPLAPLLTSSGLPLDCAQVAPPPGFEAAFLGALNGALESPQLYRDLNQLLNQRRGVASEAIRYLDSDARARVVQWVDAYLGDLFLEPPANLTPVQREAVRAANHTVLSGLFDLEAVREDRFSRRLLLYRPETLEAAFRDSGLALETSSRPFAGHLLLGFGRAAEATGGAR